MALNDSEVTYRTNLHEMWMEGTSEEKPTYDEIIFKAQIDGWIVFNIDIFFDSFQGFWRFTADLSRPE